MDCSPFLVPHHFFFLWSYLFFYYWQSVFFTFMTHCLQILRSPPVKKTCATDSCNQCTTKCPWFTASFMLGLTDKFPALSRKCQLVKDKFIISEPEILVSQEKTGHGMGNFSSFSDTSHSMNISEIGFLFAECFFQTVWFVNRAHRVARKEQWSEMKYRNIPFRFADSQLWIMQSKYQTKHKRFSVSLQPLRMLFCYPK